jgi:hypothetical protein
MEQQQTYPEAPKGKPFDESWVFPSKMKDSLQATSWSVKRTEDQFKSGRPIEEVTFHGVHPSRGGDPLHKVTRRGMTLVSKKGVTYVVVEAFA